MQRPALQKCIAVALALLVWQGAAMAVGLDLLLPSPWQVACRLWSVWREPGFFATVAFSLLRISGGFALGLVLGVLLAVAAGRLRVLELLLWPYVTAIKSVPVASFIIICLIWMSTRQLAVFISFLMVFPVIYSNTLQGIKSADGALLEMARVYRVPPAAGVYLRAPGEALPAVRVQRGIGHVVEVRRGRRSHRRGGRLHRRAAVRGQGVFPDDGPAGLDGGDRGVQRGL